MKSVLIRLTILAIIVCNSSVSQSNQDQFSTVSELLKNEFMFDEYPQSDTVIELRKSRLELIQSVATNLNSMNYLKYMHSWRKKSALSDSMENTYAILKFLHEVTSKSIDNIQKTKIDSGLICWYFYNMGYVIQTSTSKIGIDLHFRGAEKLAPFLDVLLTTHSHHDHYNSKLIDSMLCLKKTVITNFYPNSIRITKDTSLYFGNNKINITIGDHHRHLPVLSSNNMLMYEIIYQHNLEKYVIFHSGDGNSIKKMKHENPVDILITHVQLPMPLSKAVYYIKPRITFVSHVLELSHSEKLPFPFRWSYNYCFNQMKKVKDLKTITLAWGERWIAKGTKFQTNQ